MVLRRTLIALSFFALCFTITGQTPNPVVLELHQRVDSTSGKLVNNKKYQHAYDHEERQTLFEIWNWNDTTSVWDIHLRRTWKFDEQGRLIYESESEYFDALGVFILSNERTMTYGPDYRRMVNMLYSPYDPDGYARSEYVDEIETGKRVYSEQRQHWPANDYDRWERWTTTHPTEDRAEWIVEEYDFDDGAWEESARGHGESFYEKGCLVRKEHIWNNNNGFIDIYENDSLCRPVRHTVA